MALMLRSKDLIERAHHGGLPHVPPVLGVPIGFAAGHVLLHKVVPVKHRQIVSGAVLGASLLGASLFMKQVKRHEDTLVGYGAVGVVGSAIWTLING